MKPFSLLRLASYISVALAGQFLEYDGIVGGVPKDSAVKNAALIATEPDAATIPTTITPGQLRYKENTGICESTPGVYQASGYANLTSRQSMWFWFFEARNNPDIAPFSIWLNGGPGSSSMIGLFQEMGPCRINKDETTVSRNPYSWNEYSNMQVFARSFGSSMADVSVKRLFIDQPIGAGYSYGDMLVGTSKDAAVAVWQMLQLFFADPKFSKYATRDFAIWTESYGGHYGPVFASYFLDQNTAIDAGKVNGVKINLKVLSIGNGLTDPYSQYPGYVKYAISNPYHPLANETIIRAANNSLYAPGGCMNRIKACNSDVTGVNSICSDAQSYCNEHVLAPFAEVYNIYDVRVRNSDPNPYPPDLHKLLTNSSLIKEIGAESNWTMTNTQVYTNFAGTGDWMRNARPALEKVINAGVRTLIISGDADYICNYIGYESMVDALQTQLTSELQQQAWTNWTVAGTVAGQYKNAGSFSYLRVYQAGHEVPAYGNGNLEVGQAALVYFTQFMQGKPISSA